MERSKDWLRQSKRDLEHAVGSSGLGHFEWACFAAHQAAEKAIKAVFERLHGEAWGHTVRRLLVRLSERAAVPEELKESAGYLDQHYIPTRYPNGFEDGAPLEFYSKKDADRAIQCAREIIEFCEGHLSRP